MTANELFLREIRSREAGIRRRVSDDDSLCV